MKRVVDYVADFIYNQGINYVFMVTGGGMMFLSDAIRIHPQLKYICNHHEQASAMAAVSYCKYTGNLGAALVTTGCGGTNTITGVLHAWQDNVPCIFISGQCKRKETIQNSGLKLRQFGVQEADIIRIVEPITKYSVMVNDPKEILYHLEKAVYFAKSGRPGPVWLDIPLDVQASLINQDQLKHFSESEITKKYKNEPTDKEIDIFIQLLNKSERPIIIAGQGIRLANAIGDFKEFIENLRIPVVASRLGIGILPYNCDLYIGSIGNKGDRAGNFAVQNADLVVAIGSRLSVSTTGHEYDKFARGAKIVVIDIDPEEHKKGTVRIDLFINSDAKKFFKSIKNKGFENRRLHNNITEWLKKCNSWKERYPVCLPEYAKEKNGINIYYLIDILSVKAKSNAVFVSDTGSAFYATSQGIKIRDGQRYITSGAQAEMGYTVPACIGISAANKNAQVIGITGDGSFQMNIQELQTIVHYKLPVKIFVLNNDGYLSIRATQRKFFDSRFIGTDSDSGISFPNLKKISYAYGIKYFKAEKTGRLSYIVDKVLNYPGASICEVVCLKDQEIIPTVSAQQKDDGSIISKPLEDMYPFLDRNTFYSEMIIKPVEE